MKRTKVYGISVLVLTIAGIIGFAQMHRWQTGKSGKEYDGKAEYIKIYNRYMADGSSFSLTGTIFLYDREKKDALTEQTGFRNSKQGNNFFTRIGYLTTFLTDSLLVQVDTLHKFIDVSHIDPGERAAYTNSSFPFEKLMQDSSGFKIKATVIDQGEERILQLENEWLPEIKSISIFYNPDSYTINKAEIEWWKDGKSTEVVNGKKCWLTRIVYHHLSQPTSTITNDLATVLTIKSGAISPGSGYSDYEFTVR